MIPTTIIFPDGSINRLWYTDDLVRQIQKEISVELLEIPNRNLLLTKVDLLTEAWLGDDADLTPPQRNFLKELMVHQMVDDLYKLDLLHVKLRRPPNPKIIPWVSALSIVAYAFLLHAQGSGFLIAIVSSLFAYASIYCVFRWCLIPWMAKKTTEEYEAKLENRNISITHKLFRRIGIR